ncbi:hypothetical protein J4464_06205 [Candidatus Woesearchaeota archaeon]|nr:hypothetical protein [Candidatus Woesearchaeota archaeon]
MEWEPDLEFLVALETKWTKQGIIDKPYGLPQGDTMVREVIDILVLDGDTDYASYLREGFPQEQPVCDHQYTAREFIQSMRDGTPAGVMVYVVLYADHLESQLAAQEYERDCA